jgi:chromosome segregation ATPase
MFNPPISDLHDSYAHVARLLAVISDPAKHAQRLDELVAQQKAIDEKTAALNDMAADTRRQNSAASATTIVLNNRKTALDAREAELDERAKTLENMDRVRSDEALQKREDAVQAREKMATREEERLAAIRADLEQRIAKIKAATA